VIRTLSFTVALAIAASCSSERPDPQIAAHRGAGTGPAENTLPSIRYAASSAAQWIEADVRRTATPHRYVLLHDPTLDRTTTCTGPVAAHTLAYISGRCRTAGGGRVPELGEYLDQVRETKLRLLLELKEGFAARQVHEVTRIVAAHRMAERAILLTFSLDQLRAALDHAPTQEIWILARTLDDPDIEPALAAGADGLDVEWRALASRSDLVSSYRERGVVVGVWTADDERAWAALADAGVDLIATDRPRALATWLASDR
jgi:glycerophosphoryl diester phosphodiesterase